jgi:hypothetical protein
MYFRGIGELQLGVCETHLGSQVCNTLIKWRPVMNG